MAPTLTTNIVLVIYFLYLTRPSHCFLMAPCPSGSNSSCCACVSIPGCSWYKPPGAAAFCASSPFLSSRDSAPDWVQEGSRVSPAYESDVIVMTNLPFNQARGRILAPQRVSLGLAVGTRFHLPFQVSPNSPNIRLHVRGPSGNNGSIEFSLRKQDDESCVDGLRKLNRRGTTRGGRPAGRQQRSVPRRVLGRRVATSALMYPTRQVYVCRGAGPGLVNRLLLVLDVKRCLQRPVQVRVIARENGRRSILRVRVRSLCECPACEAGPSSTEGGNSAAHGNRADSVVQNSALISTATYRTACNATNSVVQCGAAGLIPALSPAAMLCLRRAVNDVCAPSDLEAYGRVCNGRGVCLCGECVCSARHELYPTMRYTGTYCQCDDFSCEMHNGALCGGPTRGRCACGQCACYPDYTGNACEISTDQSTCIAPMMGTDSEPSVCSGRGSCIDGQCECSAPFSGSYCECDDTSCPLHRGELCGGPSRGRCQCGQCVCIAGRQGPACETDDIPSQYEQMRWEAPPASCLGPGENSWSMVCSGRGVCVAGNCVCSSVYTGSVCQNCPTC